MSKLIPGNKDEAPDIAVRLDKIQEGEYYTPEPGTGGIADWVWRKANPAANEWRTDVENAPRDIYMLVEIPGGKRVVARYTTICGMEGWFDSYAFIVTKVVAYAIINPPEET